MREGDGESGRAPSFRIEASEPKTSEPKAPEKAAETAAEPKPADVDTAPAAAPPAAATATPAPEPVKAASIVPPADQPVADKLRELLGAKASRYFDRKGERAAVEKFYTAREFAPLWTQSGALTASAKGVIARLKDAASEGLNAADYPVPDFAAATTPDALAEAELKLTASMLDYARQAQSGRMHWSQVAADILYPEHPTDPAEVLANVTTAKDASAALESYNPPHKLYQELKAKLAELRGQGDGPVMQIAEGPPLAFKAATKKQPAVAPEDPRVPQLRAKLGITENPDDTQYDAKVAAAVRKFQEGADLKPTGVLDDRTVKAINSPKRDRQIDTVIVNMERWRWLPRQLGAPSLGNAYVMLNVPDFTLKVMQKRRAGLDHPGGDRQAGQSCHAAADRDDEVHHRQSDLERAALDHLQRIPAGAAAGSDRAAAHGPAGWNATATAAFTSRSRPAKPTRSAAFVSTSRTSSWSISTTPRTSICSPRKSARSAMAACGCRIRISTPRRCSTSCCRTKSTRRKKSAACMAAARSTSISRRRSRSTSPTRPRSWTRPASCNCARMSTAATPR